MKREERGSMTLEACMVVPIFIALMLLVNGLFIFFLGQEVMQNALIQSAKNLAFEPYATQRIKGEDTSFIAEIVQGAYDFFDAGGGDYVSSSEWYEEDSIEEVVKDKFLLYLSPVNSDELLKRFGVKDGASGIDFSGSSIKDGVLTVKMSFTQEFVFDAMDLASFEDSMQVKVKLFEYKEVEE